eukprot:6309000-Prymnesium_polylepis.1
MKLYPLSLEDRVRSTTRSTTHPATRRTAHYTIALGEAVLVEVARANAAHNAVGLVVGAFEALV